MEIDLDEISEETLERKLSRTKNLAGSTAREAHLDRLGKLLVGKETTVELGEVGRNELTHDGTIIKVVEEPCSQHVTDLPEDVWDLLAQEMATFHGAGHILWTDYEGLEVVRAEADDDELFQYIFNVGEDACIDTFLARRFDIRDRLALRYENALATAQSQSSVNFLTAIGYGLLDNGFYDSGTWQAILDGQIDVEIEMLVESSGSQDKTTMKRPISAVYNFDPESMGQRISRLMSFAKQESDGSKRANLFRQFADYLGKKFAAAAVPEKPLRSGFTVKQQKSEHRRDDLFGLEFSETAQPQDESPADCEGEDESPIDCEIDELGQASTTDGHAPIEQGEITACDIDQGTHEAKLQAQSRELAAMSDAAENEQTLKQLKQMSSSADETIVLPEQWESPPKASESIEDCERNAETLAQILRATLQQERTSSRRYGTERGQLESSQLPYAAAGRRAIKSEEIDPEDKDYSAQFVLDRSGSMKGACIENAQRALTQLALGLHKVGAEVSVLSLYDSRPQLEVPLGADPQEYYDRLFSYRTGGSTPLSDCLSLAKAELENGTFDQHLLLVVTDGFPDYEQRYRDLVDELSVPLFGVYINEEHDTHTRHNELFDAVRYSTPDTVDEKCRELCHEFLHHADQRVGGL